MRKFIKIISAAVYLALAGTYAPGAETVGAFLVCGGLGLQGGLKVCPAHLADCCHTSAVFCRSTRFGGCYKYLKVFNGVCKRRPVPIKSLFGFVLAGFNGYNAYGKTLEAYLPSALNKFLCDQGETCLDGCFYWNGMDKKMSTYAIECAYDSVCKTTCNELPIFAQTGAFAVCCGVVVFLKADVTLKAFDTVCGMCEEGCEQGGTPSASLAVELLPPVQQDMTGTPPVEAVAPGVEAEVVAPV